MPHTKGQPAWNKGIRGYPHKPYAPKANRWQDKTGLCLSCGKGAQTKPENSCQFWQHTNSYQLVLQRNKNGHFKRKYGLSTEDVEKRKFSQDGKCAICKEVLPLRVDHNHQSDKVRGMLCDECNYLVAHLEHPLVKRAREYLLLYGEPDPWT